MDTNPNFLERLEGRLAYDVIGSSESPLVVCVAGMGDLRSTYRFLAPALVEAGFRVASLELRGHGDSDTTFTSYDDNAAATDIVALIEHLGGPAVVVGHSMGAAAGIVAAARRPELITGLALVGPFAREPKVNFAMRALMRVLLQRWWVRPVWKAYLPSLFPGQQAPDHAEQFDAMMAALARPGHSRAFAKTLQTKHDIAEEHIGEVKAPALVVMGELDKDFPDPAAEAAWIGEQLSAVGGAQVLMVPESGHYPHAQRPDVVNPAVVAFAEQVSCRA